MNDGELDDIRHGLADAARDADWPHVVGLLSDPRYQHLINSWRPSGSSWYAPLHQAAWHGAPAVIVSRLLDLGAWRTHRNARGERPVDVAQRRGHLHLLPALDPQLKRVVPPETLLQIQAHFHAVIRSRCDELVRDVRLPELEPLLELERLRERYGQTEPQKIGFRVVGALGWFAYWLESEGASATLISESWSRVVSGSGERHEITSHGSTLVEEGFA